MKILMILITALLLFSTAFSVNAVTSTSSAQTNTLSPSPRTATSSAASPLQQFKDKLASKVEELQKQNNIGYSGYITSISGNTIQLQGTDEIYKAKIDDVVTGFFEIVGVAKKEIKLNTLTKGDYLIVSGPKNGQEIAANIIYLDVHYVVGSGKITEVNKTDFYLTVATDDKRTITIDIETATKKNLLNIKTLKSDVIGFANIKEGDTVHYVLKDNVGAIEKTRYSALRVFIIPQEFFIK